MILHNRPFAASDIDQSFLIDFNRRDSCLHDTVVSRIFPSQLTPEAEMQKVADAADISLLFFSAGANFWAILGHFWAILGHFWANLGNLGSFLGYFG